MIDYSALPHHMQNGTRLYIEHGIEPGSFLHAVICNDLAGAFSRADEMNTAMMRTWVLFFYNDAPSDCWGSPECYAAWVERGGMNATAAA